MVPYIDITGRWRPREESTKELAGRLAHWLAGIAVLDPRFTRWQRGGMRHRSVVPRAVTLPPGAEELHLWLDENPSFESRNGRKERVGYSINARTPEETAPYANIWLTARTPLRDDWFGNRIGITFFTDRDDDADHLIAVVRDALAVTASAWDCEWAAAASGNYEDMSLPQKTLLKYESGWMVYLDRILASRIHKPQEIMIEKPAGGGVLLTAVSNAVFDRRNALHIAAARRLQAALAPLNAGASEANTSA
jgi:hypothetical protein